MKQDKVIKAAAWLWGIGLVCFCFPFITQYVSSYGERESYHMNAFTLMTKITSDGVLDEEFPINGYLWVAALAGIVCLVCAIHIVSVCHDWAAARKSARPAVALISGAVGTICLFSFMNSYDFPEYLLDWDGITIKNGWGRNLALICFIAAFCCVVGAYIMEHTMAEEAEPDTGEVEAEKSTKEIAAGLMQFKLNKLKQTYLSGRITAQEYEARKKRCIETGGDSEKSQEEDQQQAQIRMEQAKRKFLDGKITAEEFERERKLLEELTRGTAEENSDAQAGGSGPNKIKIKKEVIFGTPRPMTTISCPLCDSVQPGNREVCWTCGAKFVFEGEETETPEQPPEPLAPTEEE